MYITAIQPSRKIIRFGQDPVNKAWGLGPGAHDPILEAAKAADLLKKIKTDYPDQLSTVSDLSGLVAGKKVTITAATGKGAGVANEAATVLKHLVVAHPDQLERVQSLSGVIISKKTGLTLAKASGAASDIATGVGSTAAVDPSNPFVWLLKKMGVIDPTTTTTAAKSAVAATTTVKGASALGDIWTSIEPMSGIIFTAVAAATAITSIYFFGKRNP